MRIICLFLLAALTIRASAQTRPSNEEFLNEVFPKISGNTDFAYYLIAGSDTCRFEKFDYDEWVKYHLQESVPLSTLNELAYKVHLNHEPYYWQQDKLQKATLVTARQADSLFMTPSHTGMHTIFSLSQPQFTDDGQYAVIDINWKNGLIYGGGHTFLFRHTTEGWHSIGSKVNWGLE